MTESLAEGAEGAEAAGGAEAAESAGGTAAAGRPGAATVQLTVPADPAYVSVLRTVTASLAARRDFTIDEIDDLRIAVDEASALLLPYSEPAGSLYAVFDGQQTQLQVAVSVSLAGTAPDASAVLDRTSFAWMVLSALADTIDVTVLDSRLTLTLNKTRGIRS